MCVDQGQLETCSVAYTVDCMFLTCSFDATASSDDGDIESYAWDFGDGNEGTGAQVTHVVRGVSSRIVTPGRTSYTLGMARPLRIEFAGALYHITSRGDRCEAIYEDDEDRERFLSVLAEVVQRLSLIHI